MRLTFADVTLGSAASFPGLAIRTLMLAAIVVTMAAALLAQAPAAGAASEIPRSNSAYGLGPGDVIRIIVLKQDLLKQDGVRIDNDGKIQLLMLDETIQAACRTESELAAAIAEKYRKFILNPQVYVSVTGFNSTSVAVIGAVNSPGRFQLQRPVRLLEILTLVNGPAPNASNEVQILRTTGLACGAENTYTAVQWSAGGTEPEIISLNIKDVLDGTSQSNPLLRGGDIVRVVPAEQKQAYIVGSVKSAVTVNLKDPVTLSTAIAMTGGTLPDAKIDKIKISRQAPGSLTKKDILVNLKEIRSGTREDFFLEPNDIVDVPGPSGAKKYLKDILRTVVPVFTRGVPIIIP